MGPRRLFRIVRLRLRSLVRTDALETELDREFAFHFDQLVAEHMDEGVSADEARRAAHRALGNVAALEEVCRDQRRVTWAHDLRQDIVYGLRMLRRQPGFTAIVALSLALGIGANAAVLGAIDALLFEGLPIAHADRLVAIQTAPLDNPSRVSAASLPDYAAWRDRSRAFENVEASIKWASEIGAEPGGSAERALGQRVTPGWLPMLGIPPLLGRVFTNAENQPNQPPVIVISHAFWQRHYGGDPNVLNTRLHVDGVVRTIIGVMPPEFRYQEPAVDYWVPLSVSSQPDASARLFGVRARLRPGVTVAQAQAELAGLAADLAMEEPARGITWRGWGVRVRPLDEFLFGWTREPLLTLEAAVALVLLIACANVAALLLSRASVRQREVALRVALGAGRGRIVRQLLTESVLLSMCGGLAGLLVAWVGLRALVTMNTPPGSPALAGVGLNAHVLGLMAMLTIGAGIACGLVPAITGSQLDPISPLKGARLIPGPKWRRDVPRGAFVSVQLALALVLLIGSGLLMNSFVRLARRDLHFTPGGLVQFDLSVPAGQYAHRIGSYGGFPYFEINPPPSRTLERVLQRLIDVPGAESVAGISSPPVDSFVLATVDVRLDGASSRGLPPGVSGPDSGVATGVVYFLVTPNLFPTIRTPMLRGRDFTARDTASSPWVAIVNETAARRLWPGQDPIRQRLTLDTVPEEQPREVVGVVRDIPTRHAEGPQPVIYASYLQQPSRYRAPWAGLPGQMTFFMRSSGDPTGLVPAARRAVAEIDPARPLVSISTVDDHMRSAMGGFRSYVLLVSVFAGTAMLLAAIGTYGVMAYMVSQRTREIGIRRALGAGPREVVALVGRWAFVLVSIGLVAGMAGALLLTRLIASQLWGVTPTDPATFAGVSLLLVVVAIIACIVPARRAMAVDPTIALKSE